MTLLIYRNNGQHKSKITMDVLVVLNIFIFLRGDELSWNLEPSSLKAIFGEYNDTSKAYRIYIPS